MAPLTSQAPGHQTTYERLHLTIDSVPVEIALFQRTGSSTPILFAKDVFPRLGPNLKAIYIKDSYFESILDLRITFPRLQVIELEGILYFLPFVLINELDSLERLVVSDADAWPELLRLDEILHVFPTVDKPGN